MTNVIWICKNCEGEPVFSDAREFIGHCKEVHGLKMGDQITLTPLMFLDGRGVAERRYKGDCKGLAFYKIETDVRGPR